MLLQVELRSEDRFFVLACDGVWDVMSNQEVVQFVSVCLDSGMTLDSIASQLLDACLAPDPRETRGIGGHTPGCEDEVNSRIHRDTVAASIRWQFHADALLQMDQHLICSTWCVV